jgi:hypothetical protein
VFVPGKPFQPSQVIADKAGAYPSGASFRGSILGLAPGLSYKHQTSLERLARGKHSSLLRKFVTYVSKKLVPGSNVINPFTAVICEFLYKPRVFVRMGRKSLLGTNTPAYYENS